MNYQPNEYDITALHAAVEGGFYDITFLLLENGANPDLVARCHTGKIMISFW